MLITRPDVVAVWAGKYKDVPAWRNYLGEPAAEEDQAPSEFQRDFNLDWYDNDFQDASVNEFGSAFEKAFLAKASFAQSYIDALIDAATRRGLSDCSSIVLIFDAFYEGKNTSNPIGSVHFVGNIPYAKS